MTLVKKLLMLSIVMLAFVACNQQDKTTSEPQKQSYTNHTPIAHHEVALEVITASKDWISNFNSGNAKACVAGYTADAVMSALPFGVKTGQKAISEFWTPFMASGATNLFIPMLVLK